MGLLAKMERRLGWLAFPGFLRFYAMLQALTFILQLAVPDMGSLMAFERTKVFEGEYWRVITFLFASPGAGNHGNVLLATFFLLMISFMVSDGLESAWGTFSASIFYYTGILCMMVVNFTVGFGLPGTSLFLHTAAFLAFATLYPKVELRVMFILPVEVWLLALISTLVLFTVALKFPVLLPFYFLIHLNYLLWAGIPALRGRARVIESAQRRQKFNQKKLPAGEGFHSCAVCKRTENDAPGLEFRVSEDGVEYCTEHLPELKE